MARAQAVLWFDLTTSPVLPPGAEGLLCAKVCSDSFAACALLTPRPLLIPHRNPRPLPKALKQLPLPPFQTSHVFPTQLWFRTRHGAGLRFNVVWKNQGYVLYCCHFYCQCYFSLNIYILFLWKTWPFLIVFDLILRKQKHHLKLTFSASLYMPVLSLLINLMQL